MSEIDVKMAKIKSYAETQKKIGKELKRLDEQVRNCSRNLQKCLSSENCQAIQKYLLSISQTLEKRASLVETMANVLEDVVETYRDTEQQIVGISIKLENIDNVHNNEFDLLKLLGIDTDIHGVIDIINMISKIIKENDGMSFLGLLGPGLKYIERLYEFYTGDKKGLTGARDILGLGQDSMKLWNGLYKILNKRYKLDSNMAKLSTEVSIFCAIYGIFEKAYTAMDTHGKSQGQTISDWLETLGGTTDLAKAICKMDGKKMSPVSGTGAIVTIADMAIAFLAEIPESFWEYKADGKFDFMDGVETAVDSSVAGLGKLVKNITLGIVDIDEDYASEAAKNWATDKGTQIGTYINNNPTLHDMAVNGNIFEKISAYTWATFCI